MAHIENKVLEELMPKAKKAIYSRYVDNIFVVVSNVGQRSELKAVLTSSSVLTFTHELENKNSLSFLDVTLQGRGSRLHTSVHVKWTNEEECLKEHSISPERNKTGLLRLFSAEHTRYVQNGKHSSEKSCVYHSS